MYTLELSQRGQRKWFRHMRRTNPLRLPDLIEELHMRHEQGYDCRIRESRILAETRQPRPIIK